MNAQKTQKQTTQQHATQKTDMNQPEQHQFSAEIAKVLQLMIHSLYTNRDIFLRELISNASDACDKLRYRARTENGLLQEGEELHITVRVHRNQPVLEITDNGIGMTRAEMIQNLGTIARSGTQEFAAQLSGDKNKDSSLIGQFGVGFYSSYMAATNVEVTSRSADDAQGHIWRSAGDGLFTIEPAEGDVARGTTIRLHLREDCTEYQDPYRVRHIIQTYSDHIAFPIMLEDVDAEEQDARTPQLVNDGSALWARSKSDITEEQYQEFYRHVAHSPDKPYAILHNRAEGVVEYTNLLYIPGMKPFDLFHPERRRRVKLYVKRVYITEENIDLIPVWLRFLRGVIDSQDLPLNISRETLQANPVLKKIRESITSRVLNELAKKADKDTEGYATFWNNFGGVLKEGLCEQDSPRDKLLEVCRFYSSTHEGLVSFAEYINRMKEGQEDIYYLTADSEEAAKRHPQLEGFTKRGVEVLLLCDHVDDFWVNVVHEVQGKPLKSITRANIDLDSFTKDDQAETTPEAPASDDLITRFKAVLGSAVKDVRTTTKLGDTPACLAVDAHDMDLRMERFLLEHNQLPKRAAKILEINASHPLLRRLSSGLEDASREQDIADAAWLLLDQARIIEGEGVEDGAAFAKRMAKFMLAGFK